VIASCGPDLPGYTTDQLMGVQTYPGYIKMDYDTNNDGDVDVEVVRKRRSDGKVSEPFMIYWDRNFDGKYDCKKGEQKVRKGCREEAERFMELDRKQAGDVVL
jgi:hypothetical protein